jgi:hypothetical protein
VVHGGQLYRGTMNYLRIRTFDDRMELELKQMRGRKTGIGQLWAPRYPRPIDAVHMYPGARVVGRMTIHEDGDLSSRTGYLREGIGHMPEDKAPRRRTPATIGTPLSVAPRPDPDAQPPRSIGTPLAPAGSAPPPFVAREPPGAPRHFVGALWSVLPLLRDRLSQGGADPVVVAGR